MPILAIFWSLFFANFGDFVVPFPPWTNPNPNSNPSPNPNPNPNPNPKIAIFGTKKGISKLPKVAIVKTAVFKGGTLKLPKMAILPQQFLYRNYCINLPFLAKKEISKLPKLATKWHCFSIEKMLAQNCHFWQFCGLKIAKIGKIEGATKLPKMSFEHT